MKGLKEFIEDLAKDNKLKEKFKDLKDVKEIVKLAKKKGYEFTEDEYMDKQMEAVSGGCGGGGIGSMPCNCIPWDRQIEYYGIYQNGLEELLKRLKGNE